MSLTELANEFNTTFLQMITEVSENIDNSEIDDTICNALGVIIRNYPDKIIGIYMCHVLPHKKEIEIGDESYFLNNDNLENKYKEDQTIMNKMMTFKKLWKRLDSANKSVIIQYLSYLCTLAE